MAPTIDLYPLNDDGRLVYVAPAPLSIEPSGFWIAVTLVLALLVSRVVGDRA